MNEFKTDNKYDHLYKKIDMFHEEEYEKLKRTHNELILKQLTKQIEQMEHLKSLCNTEELNFKTCNYTEMKKFVHNFLSQLHDSKEIEDIYFKFDHRLSDSQFRLLQKLFDIVDYDKSAQYDDYFMTKFITKKGKINKLKNQIRVLEMELTELEQS